MYVIATAQEVWFYGVILAFIMAIGLWMESDEEWVIDVQMGAQSSPKLAGEMRAAVGDFIDHNYKLADHALEIHTCYLS
jgi:hypothetical protein